jgi:hypothetical protein
MLLSLLGVRTTRDGALRLFGLGRINPNYHRTTHQNIGLVISRVLNPSRWRWRYYDRFAFDSVSKALARQLKRTNCPTLISFGAIHKNNIWRCKHIAVVVGATSEVIELVDPLGQAPRWFAKANVWFSKETATKIKIIGNPYSINYRSEVAILHWFPSKKRFMDQSQKRFRSN